MRFVHSHRVGIPDRKFTLTLDRVNIQKYFTIIASFGEKKLYHGPISWRFGVVAARLVFAVVAAKDYAVKWGFWNPTGLDGGMGCLKNSLEIFESNGIVGPTHRHNLPSMLVTGNSAPEVDPSENCT
jgi:hypothetical protein